ncbi:hypothetical protein JCM3770_000157 [Rhodotorula araucariae]
MSGRPASPRSSVQPRATRSYTCHGPSRSHHHHHYTAVPALPTLARPVPVCPATLPLSRLRPPSAAQPLQQHTEMRHPALAHVHAQRAQNLGLLDTLDDETLAALANELREIGLGAARARGGWEGARRAPVQVVHVQQAWGGRSVAMGEHRGAERGPHIARRQSDTGPHAHAPRRIAAAWNPLFPLDPSRSCPGPERAPAPTPTPTPPPAYAPIDPLTHLPPLIFPLGTAHPSALNAPLAVRESEEGVAPPARSGAIRAERRGRRWSDGTV